MSAVSPASPLQAAEPDSEADEREGGELRRSIGRAARRPGTIVALLWIALIIVVSVFAHQIAPDNPLAQDLSSTFASPSGHHLLGTDELGRDILSRLVFGGRTILLVSVEAVGIAVLVGVPLGLLAGYLGGAVDVVTSFIVDVLFAIPGFVVLLAVAFITKNALWIIMAAFGVICSASVLRLVRAATQSARNRQYVEYARITALSPVRIVWRHVLPNVLAPLIVQVFFLFGVSFVVVSSLSFLSLGFNPATPSWGQMVFDATQNIAEHGFMMVPVGVVLTCTVLAFNQLGSALRSALPQSGQARLLADRRGRLFTAAEALVSDPGLVPADPTAFLDETAAGLADPPPAPVQTAGVEAAARPGTAPVAADSVPEDVLLEVEGLSVSFPGENGRFDVVDDVSFHVRRGETLALVGESGSGKTLTTLALIGLLPQPGRAHARRITFDGADLTNLRQRDAEKLRGRGIAYVSQEPIVALDPCFTVESTLTEPLRVVRGLGRREARAQALELLRTVGIADAESVARRYPHQLSGGMAQRISIALALTSQPKLLIADEPTTALDVTIQAEILDLLRSLQERTGMAIILVTHDLGVVADVAARVAVMYAAQLVETGSVAEILTNPSHPYTLSLMGAAPAAARGGRLASIGGATPSPHAFPPGCRFAARCPVVIDACTSGPVPLMAEEGRWRRCVRPPEEARRGSPAASQETMS